MKNREAWLKRDEWVDSYKRETPLEEA